ncbi:glycoside hydrolase family 5 protein [Cellulophaga baltica]|uniref:glycoside hydrolase family 5 protein n=1 Tax=Cellulophaga TaxID=104264 RepID=UPI001C06AA44|nr:MULTISPECIES: glycoside hydrolase family 5 protein [Cellulophaga]MBU2996512.1 glycoside hydrolase family 5 protein [Cellulophaga baltica]MDO6767906.1 glycoside hydrolase family 5 protein [Cellulophaga sp. 1_MG-2023]
MKRTLLNTILLCFILCTSCSNNEDFFENEITAETEEEEISEDEDEVTEEEQNEEEEEDTEETLDYTTVVEEYGQLSVSGSKIIDQDNNEIQLRGMSLFWSQWMGQFYTSGTVNWLQSDWNATIVRASMGVEDSDGYLSNPDTEKAKVFTVIDAAIEAGIYVIVDWHSHYAEQNLEEAKAFFAEVAQKYGDYPNIIYETYNEPLDVSWVDVLKPYHESVIATIRQYDSNNIIVCGTRTWSQRVDEVVGNEIDDDNVAYTLHYYSSTHKEELRNYASTAINNNIAIFVTEFGVTEASGGGSIDVDSANTWWSFLDENKISWCNWSIADKDESSAALTPGASGDGNWNESELTTSGSMVRTEMLAKNPTY